MISSTLARREAREVADRERLHWLWVSGPDGAVSTWFCDTVAVLGHSVCDGPTFHSTWPAAGYPHAHRCTFLDGEHTWCCRGSMHDVEMLTKHYDAGDLWPVWLWLGEQYILMRHQQEL